MDLKGFEPLTSSMPWKRAPNCATGPHLLEGHSYGNTRPSRLYLPLKLTRQIAL